MAVACSRRWQVAAARDGRLTGKDRASADRHRELCTECATEQRRWHQIAHSFALLPSLSLDPLNSRRARQKLLAAVERSCIGEPPQRHSLRFVASLVLVPAAVLAYGSFLHRGLEPDGRVPAHLNGQHEIALGAAEHGERPTGHAMPLPLPPNGSITASPIDQRLEATAAAKATRPHAMSTPFAKPAPKLTITSRSDPPARGATVDSESARAEDAAYLKIVSLLRKQQSGEARAQAKAYLLLFPNGFRRIEVLDIATSGVSDTR